MAEKIRVMIPEEEVDAKIKELGREDQREVRRRRGSPDLYSEGKRILCVRAGKENHRAGDY